MQGRYTIFVFYGVGNSTLPYLRLVLSFLAILDYFDYSQVGDWWFFSRHLEVLYTIYLTPSLNNVVHCIFLPNF